MFTMLHFRIKRSFFTHKINSWKTKKKTLKKKYHYRIIIYYKILFIIILKSNVETNFSRSGWQRWTQITIQPYFFEINHTTLWFLMHSISMKKFHIFLFFFLVVRPRYRASFWIFMHELWICIPSYKNCMYHIFVLFHLKLRRFDVKLFDQSKFMKSRVCQFYG